MRLSGMLRPTSKSNMIATVILLLVVLPGVQICEGRAYLTGSATTAVAGHPFIFTCELMSGVTYLVRWTGELQNRTSEWHVSPYSNCRTTSNNVPDIYIYNFTCSPHMYTLTILDVDYNTHRKSNWTCFDYDYYERSNIVTLDVNVPLDTATLLNATTNALNLSEGDTMLLLCETNPTRPPSSITWLKDDDIIAIGTSSSIREEGGLSVTVGRLSTEVTRELHRKRVYCVGHYEETNFTTNGMLLHIDVPLVEISIMNSTNSPMAMTENDDVTLVCETNPTIPSSTIVWMKENNTLSEDVTSLSRPVNGAVVAVSMATFAVSCDDHLTRIRCSGVYKSTQITSKSQTLFVHCITKEEASTSGATFGAGVGVGMTLCLLPLLVAVAVYIVWWRRHQTQEDKTQPTESTPSRAAQPQLDSRQTTNIYESMDESTKQRNNTTYEDIHLQVYENTA
ncbi:uncharacterized protein LOC124120574 [Haliotis rufescens]|uniref:uncharacterized protein LOC124120574 n=1 Tax=Haliotis rufescens TaxID=6454 RepID=UPI00201E99CC|nr:uncharacterized protein LOC124120574 [Haliotis rufescens]